MNKIDIEFSALIKTVKEMEKDELFHLIKNNFFKIPIFTQRSLEDYFKKFDYWGSLDIDKGEFDVFKQKATSLHKNVEKYIWLYQKLGDYRSKYVLYSIISNAIYFDFSNLQKCTENAFKHYFDLDIYPQAQDEVFVDVGSYTGDSVLDFVDCYGDRSYKEIYCFEITKSVIEQSKTNLVRLKNVRFIQKALGSEKGQTFLRCSQVDPSANQTSSDGDERVEVTTLDEEVQEKISMIKMDIEGGEKDALKGAKRHIKNDSPCLMIAVYHKHDDIWQIPKMIYNMNKGYDFYLRYNGGPIFPTETTLICKQKD